MKKIIISIIGIALMLFAFTACQPRYIFVPIPGGDNGGGSTTDSASTVFVSDGKDFKEAVDRCGLKGITLHTLRHTFASRRLAEGVPMKAIQLWLGHRSYKTTADIYAHESPEFLTKAVSIVEDQRRKGPKKSH